MYHYNGLLELITVRESFFRELSEIVSHAQIDLTNTPVIDRVNQTLEDLRLGGNDLVELARQLEYQLMIPAQRRFPEFFFED